MSRIARAVSRLSIAFAADPALALTKADIERLTELDADETESVIEALVEAGALVLDQHHFRPRPVENRQAAVGQRSWSSRARNV